MAASLVVAAACHSPTEDTSADSSPTSEAVTDSGTEATPPRQSRLCSDPEDFDRQLDLPAEGEALTLHGAETHAFTLTTREDETLEILADQDGIDVYLALFDGAGERLVATDRPTARLGEERLIWIGGSDRALRLHVCAWGSQGISGDYTLALRRRPVEPGDRATVTAYRHVEEAKRLRRLGPTRWDDAVDTLRLAIAQEVHSSGQFLRSEALYRLARYLQEQQQLEEALGLLDTLDAEHDHRTFPELAVKILNRRAVILRALLRYDEAPSNYDRAMELATGSGHPRLIATVWSNKGDYFQSVDQVSAAISSYDRAFELWREVGDTPKMASTLYSRGYSFGRLGKSQESLDDLEEALGLQDSLGLLRLRAETLLRIGFALNGLQRPVEAETAVREAIRLFEEAGSIDRRGVAMSNLVASLNNQLRHEEALEVGITAFEVVPSFGNLIDTGVLAHNIAVAHEGLENFPEALSNYETALSNFTEAGDLRARSITRLGIAQVQRKQGHLEQSLDSIVEAIREVETLRAGLDSYDLRASYLATERSQYEFLIDLLMELHEAHPEAGYDLRALAISERSRARSQLDALEDRNNPDRGDDSGASRREDLAAQIRDLERRRAAAASASHSAELDDLERRLRRLLLRYRRAEALKQRPDRGPALDLEEGFDLSAVRQVLDDDTALLEYHLGLNRSFLWIVRTDHVVSLALPSRQVIEEEARSTYRRLAKSYQRRLLIPVRSSLCRLSELLLPPTVSHLETERLLIASEGALDFIPFGALPLPSSCSETSAVPRPLSESFEVVSIPSATLLGAVRRLGASRLEPSRELLVLADPMPSKSTSDPPPSSFARLEHSRVEAQAILESVAAENSVALFGEQANYESLMASLPTAFRIIHFATHGELDTDHPELSRLVLTPGLSSDGSLKEYLYAHEIDDLDLVADLVVLSACETALGTEIRGEGLIGLPQAFMVAGASAVLVSFWKVDDLSTSELMTAFYDSLFEEGLDPAAALAAAQRKVRQHRPEPYYWAGFSLLGDWKEFERSPLESRDRVESDSNDINNRPGRET